MMEIKEKNLEILSQVNKDLYDALQQYEKATEDVRVGTACNEDAFMTVVHEGTEYALCSMVEPDHAADRFVNQFSVFTDPVTLLLFGFGDGKIVRRLVSPESIVQTCIVYEPSVDILCKALETYDLTDVLASKKLTLIVRGINDAALDVILQRKITHSTWKYCYIVSLPVYDQLYEDALDLCAQKYEEYILNRKAEFRSAVAFAKKSLENEIHAQQWMMDAYAGDGLVGKFPADVPCIVVAAGPSLEKNVEELKRAKGKACIFAVDTALKFLLQHDIVPDFLCTVDAEKSSKYFDGVQMKGFPIFLSTNSNFELYEQLQGFVPIFFSTINEYYEKLVAESGHTFWTTDGGGSVATMCFWLAAKLGFHDIIIIGQDLAFTGMNSHAGTGKVTKEEVEVYTMYDVPGYNGDTVLTRGDFKLYIDWYNRIIPRLTPNHRIINATEGGAKLEGAEQLTLAEAIDQCCHETVDCTAVLRECPKIWETKEEKLRVYEKLKDALEELRKVREYAEQGGEQCDKALAMMGRPHYDELKFSKLEEKINKTLSALSTMDMYRMLLNRIADNQVAFYDSAHKKIDDLDERRKYLYESVQAHLQSLQSASEECMTMWQWSVDEIGKQLEA